MSESLSELRSTVAVRNNITLRADDLCGEWLNFTADKLDAELERNKDKMRQALNDLTIFGQTTVYL